MSWRCADDPFCCATTLQARAAAVPSLRSRVKVVLTVSLFAPQMASNEISWGGGDVIHYASEMS